MSWTLAAGFGLFLAGAAAVLAQLWLQPCAPETFAKIMITDGILLAVVVVWHMIQRERRDTAQLRERKRLDP
jgi:membrane protein implicated in regulation of membrane protease activity